MYEVQCMETWQGKKNAIVSMYTDWCDANTGAVFDTQLPQIWANGNVPMVTWQPFLCGSTPPNIAALIAGGAYDSYLTSWAGALKTFLSGPDGSYGTADDRRLYLRLAQEMNGSWYPWSAGATSPSDYIAMWRHVKGVLGNVGIDSRHVQWIWSVNNADATATTAEQLYPGDAYVDWVGIDGYNWGGVNGATWFSPSDVFGDMLRRLRALTSKPLAITEVGTTNQTASGPDNTAKGQWISDFFAYVASTPVELVSWFNEDKEMDWAVLGGANGDATYPIGFGSYYGNYGAYSAYPKAVGASRWLSSDPTNPRLLTDSQFAGK